MPTIDEIVAAIDDRIPVIGREREQLEAARPSARRWTRRGAGSRRP